MEQGSRPRQSRFIAREQAGNIVGTFGPSRAPSIQSCATPTIEVAGRTLIWRLQCRGQLDIDPTDDFNFDSSRQYSAIITSKGNMAGALISDVKSNIEAERIGECTQ